MNILEKYLKNNKKVEIEFFSQEKTAQTYKTGFYKITEEKYILYKPQDDITIELNQQINVYVYTSSGIFVFNTKIISFNSKIIEIEKPKNYKRIQRRELLRENIEVPFILEISQDKKQSYITKNISGSGFSFLCNEILDKNKNYSIELIFEKRKIKSRIKIIEIRKNIKENTFKYRYSVKLLSLNKSDKDYIIKECLVKNIKTINI